MRILWKNCKFKESLKKCLKNVEEKGSGNLKKNV